MGWYAVSSDNDISDNTLFFQSVHACGALSNEGLVKLHSPSLAITIVVITLHSAECPILVHAYVSRFANIAPRADSIQFHTFLLDEQPGQTWICIEYIETKA